MQGAECAGGSQRVPFRRMWETTIRPLPRSCPSSPVAQWFPRHRPSSHCAAAVTRVNHRHMWHQRSADLQPKEAAWAQAQQRQCALQRHTCSIAETGSARRAMPQRRGAYKGRLQGAQEPTWLACCAHQQLSGRMHLTTPDHASLGSSLSMYTRTGQAIQARWEICSPPLGSV